MPFPRPSVAIVATLLGGGFAGAVFTYWVNRPQTTVVSYSISSATIADTESGSIVPGLKVQIGSQDIRNLYTHSIVLTVTKGPQLDSGDVAIDFQPNTRLFGEPSIGTPSPVHKLECSKITSGLICKMSPVRREDKLPPFRVAVATDEKADPGLVTSTKGLELQPAQETLTAASRQAASLQTALGLVGAVVAALSLWIFKERLGLHRDEMSHIELEEEEDELRRRVRELEALRLARDEAIKLARTEDEARDRIRRHE